MTNLEGRILRRRTATPAPGEARSELWILGQLARRLGHGVGFSSDAREVFDELARASAGGIADYSGITYDRLDAGEQIHWPCPSEGHPGTPRVFLDEFATPNGRARAIAVDHRGPADDVRSAAPVYLVTGRVLTHYQSGAQTRRVPELNDAAPSPYVELSPVLADTHGILEGDMVAVTSDRGTVTAQARISADMRLDTVFMPFHWGGEGSANRVTNDATDPVSGMPEYKACAVAIDRVVAHPDARLAPPTGVLA